MSSSDGFDAGTAGAAGTPKSGLMENIIEVLYAPSKVFDRTRATKAGVYAVVTAVIVGAIMFGTKNLMLPWLDAQGDLAVKMAAAKGTPMPDAAVSSMRTFTSWGFIIGAPLVMLIGPYINALFLVVGAKMMKVPLKYSQAAMIAVLAGVPRLLGAITGPIQGLLLDGSSARSMMDLTIGPARFVDPMSMSAPLLALVANVELFRIWQIALMAIGVAVVGRVERSTGIIVAVIVFAITAILQLLPTALA